MGGEYEMPQVYMIITTYAEDVLKENISSLASELISTVETEFDLEDSGDVALTIPAPVLYIKGEADVQIEIRYTAGEDEYDRGEPFDPSPKEQARLAWRIQKTFLNFLHCHHLTHLAVSVWCKPYHRSTFRMYKT